MAISVARSRQVSIARRRRKGVFFPQGGSRFSCGIYLCTLHFLLRRQVIHEALGFRPDAPLSERAAFDALFGKLTRMNTLLT